MPESKLTLEQREEIQKLYRAHNSIRGIAAKFGVDRTTIYYHLGLAGRGKGKYRVFPGTYVKRTYFEKLEIAGGNGKYRDYLLKEQHRISKTKMVKDSMGTEHRF